MLVLENEAEQRNLPRPLSPLTLCRHLLACTTLWHSTRRRSEERRERRSEERRGGKREERREGRESKK
jgi:hypothetical protein